jgi:hypothetical protein
VFKGSMVMEVELYIGNAFMKAYCCCSAAQTAVMMRWLDVLTAARKTLMQASNMHKLVLFCAHAQQNTCAKATKGVQGFVTLVSRATLNFVRHSHMRVANA